MSTHCSIYCYEIDYHLVEKTHSKDFHEGQFSVKKTLFLFFESVTQ